MAFTVGNEQQSIFSRMRKMTPAKRLVEFNRYQSRESPSPFTFLTPTQFAELFPKYYMEKLPEVGGFFKALNSRKELGGEGKTYGPHGNTEGTATATPSSSERVTNTVKAKQIYDYIRSKGVDHNHAVGIINNMKYESNFNSGVEHVDSNGLMSGGLFQHNGPRYHAMKNYVGEDWKTNWKKQIDFALTEGDMKKYLAIDYSSATDASKGFTLVFERPYEKEKTAAYRAGTAEGYGTSMSQGGLSTTSGGNFETTSSGYIVPKDKTIYTPGNEQQCATLAKAMNPDIGRSSSWTVVPGEIKPGMTVATMRYNASGGDRTGSGYHSGVAMSAPDKDGNFLLLEQFSGQTPRVRKVNANSYSGGAMGGTTQFGIISSNGKLHTEQSLEALNYGAKLAPDEESKKIIIGNHDAVSKGDATGSQQGTGSVSVNEPGTPAGGPGPQTNLEQQEAAKNIQTATIGDMFKMVGDLAGFFMRGEGIGDGRGRKRGHRGHSTFGVSFFPANAPADPSLDHTKRTSIEREAKRLNVDSHDLASAMLYESIGSLNPERMGVVDKRKGSAKAQKAGAEKRFMGLIQMGSNEQLKYGVKRGQTFDEHMVSVGKYLEDRGVKKWMESHPNASAEEKRTALYSTINAGHPEEKHWKKTDKAAGGSATTVRQKAAQMVERYGERASRLLSAEPPSPTAVAAAPQSQTATVARAPSQVASGTPAQAGTSYLDQIKSKMSGYYEGFANKMAGLRDKALDKASEAIGSSVAQPEFPAVGAKQNEVPLPPHRPTTFDNAAPAAAPDKHTFNVEKPTDAPAPKPIVADTFLNRDNPQFASPSMERQIKNTMNPSASNEGYSFLPKIG